jgi:hypothetical protein
VEALQPLLAYMCGLLSKKSRYPEVAEGITRPHILLLEFQVQSSFLFFDYKE